MSVLVGLARIVLLIFCMAFLRCCFSILILLYLISWSLSCGLKSFYLTLSYVPQSSAKKVNEYWLLWKFEGETTLADLMQSKEFPYNVGTSVNRLNVKMQVCMFPSSSKSIVLVFSSNLPTVLIV